MNPFPSSDSAERYVRHLLVQYDDAFENHWISDRTERGDYMPRMLRTIPGQFGNNHGVDIIALDDCATLWLIEVSRGTRRGAARFKGGGRPVKYAQGQLQMSLVWRHMAAGRFAAEMPEAPAMLRFLFAADIPDEEIIKKFKNALAHHKKAIIIPLGAHFDAIGTDVDFNTEVYTCRMPSQLFND